MTRFIISDTLKESEIMPTKNPRLNIVLSYLVYNTLKNLAQGEGVSLSLKAGELIKEALELYEDIYWQEKLKKGTKLFLIKKSNLIKIFGNNVLPNFLPPRYWKRPD